MSKLQKHKQVQQQKQQNLESIQNLSSDVINASIEAPRTEPKQDFASSPFFNNNLTQPQNQQEPITRTLVQRTGKCIQELSGILQKCDINTTISDSDREMLTRAQLYEKLLIVQPSQIFKLLLEIRREYEVYLQIYGQNLSRGYFLFPQLCQVIQQQKFFKQRGVYPLLQSWQYENPTNSRTTSQDFFITPQDSAFWSLTSLDDQFVNPTPIKQQNKDIFQFFDISKYQNLIRNAHPLQNLISLVYKYPSIILLLGQKLPSITQRVGLYTGYIKQFETLFINSTLPDQQIRSVTLDKDNLNNNVLPYYSLLNTPMTRLLQTAVLKSIITHDGSFQKWPATYFYQPESQKIPQYFLTDFLFSVASNQQIINWCKNTLHFFVQKLYQEKVYDFFKLLCNSQTQDSLKYIQPLLQLIVQQIINNLNNLPDAVKSVLTVAKLTIYNFIMNVAEKLFNVQNETQLTRALQQRFKELYQLIDLNNKKLSFQRIDLFINQLYKQFYGVFVLQQIIRTALNNPVSYQLLLPSQVHIHEIDIFYSNLSLLGDLVFESFMGFSQISVFNYVLDDQFQQQSVHSKLNTQAQKYFISNQQALINFKFQLSKLTVFFDEKLTPLYKYIDYSQHIYFNDSSLLKKLIINQEFQLNTCQLTSGFWCSTSQYFLFLAKIFKQNTEYLKQNFQILNRNCQDVIQQAFEYHEDNNQLFDSLTNSSTTGIQKYINFNEQMFSEEVRFCLYMGVEEVIDRVSDLLTVEKISQFQHMVQYEEGVLNGVTFIPYFNNIYQEQKSYEIMQSHSLTLDLLTQKLRQAQTEQEKFIQIIRSGQSLQYQSNTDEAQELNNNEQNIEKQQLQNVSSEIKQFYQHCDQIIELYDLLSKLQQLKENLNQLNNNDEDEFFTKISKYNIELSSLQQLTENTIKDIQHYTDDISQRKEEQNVLENIKKLIYLEIDQLNNKIHKNEEIIEDQLNEEQELQILEQNAQYEKEYQYFKNQQQFDELVFNYQQICKKLHNQVNNIQSFIPSSTLEKVFNKQINQIYNFRSNVYQKLFNNEQNDQETSSQQPSEEESVGNIEELNELEKEFGEQFNVIQNNVYDLSDKLIGNRITNTQQQLQ